jgi:copper resistance protein B
MMRWRLFVPLAMLACPAAAQHEGHGSPPAASSQSDASPAAAPPQGPPPVPETPAADAVYDPAAMERARGVLREEHGGSRFSQVLFDLAEVSPGRGRDLYRWDAQAWFGGDFDRLVLKSEGEASAGDPPEQAEIQALWGHAIAPYFNLQAGVRYDVRPDPERAYAVVGVEGLAPYWFEVEAHAFLSNKGELFARLKAEHDMLITQRLILQPRVEAEVAFQDVPAIGAGSGVQDVELGLRLRYEIAREFAPYAGVQYQRLFGATRRYASDAGDEAGSTRLVLGVRAWF